MDKQLDSVEAVQQAGIKWICSYHLFRRRTKIKHILPNSAAPYRELNRRPMQDEVRLGKNPCHFPHINNIRIFSARQFSLIVAFCKILFVAFRNRVCLLLLYYHCSVDKPWLCNQGLGKNSAFLTPVES